MTAVSASTSAGQDSWKPRCARPLYHRGIFDGVDQRESLRGRHACLREPAGATGSWIFVVLRFGIFIIRLTTAPRRRCKTSCATKCEWGLVFQRVRHDSGECIAAFKPAGREHSRLTGAPRWPTCGTGSASALGLRKIRSAGRFQHTASAVAHDSIFSAPLIPGSACENAAAYLPTGVGVCCSLRESPGSFSSI